MCIETGNRGNDYVCSLLNEAKFIPVDTEVDPEKITFPPWYDEKLFKKGQKFYTRNIFAVFVGNLCGLIAVLAIPSILNVLICTGKSSTTLTAYRRYIRTIFHVVTWGWFSFGSKPNDTRAWQSLISVRKIHLRSSKYCTSIKNIFISQRDMALTQFGFMGFTTLRADLLGLNNYDDHDGNMEATIHFWRVIGFMLGIKDEYNLCTDNWQTTKERLQVVMDSVYKPALQNDDRDFMEMTTALIDGLWSFNPFLSVDTYLFFTRRLAGCDGYEYLKGDYKTIVDEARGKKLYRNLKNYNRFTLYMLIYILQNLYKYRILKWYFNFQIYLSLFLIYWFPFLAYHRFGFKQSYVRILK